MYNNILIRKVFESTMLQLGREFPNKWKCTLLFREDLHTWKLEARKRRLTFLSSNTWISNVKYFFTFFTIITKNGSFMPSVAAGSAGHVIYVDWTFVPTISRIFDCISSSCVRFTWPLTTKIPKNYKYYFNPFKGFSINERLTLNKFVNSQTEMKIDANGRGVTTDLLYPISARACSYTTHPTLT